MEPRPDILAHDDSGHGIPALFIHGFPHDRGFWAPAVRLLKGHVRCVVPDLPGFGSSPLPDEQPTLDSIAEDLAALLDHSGLDRVVVCGLSMGGYAALALWRRHPERIKAIILCDTRAAADGPEARGKRDALIQRAVAEGPRVVADLQLPATLGQTTRDRAPNTVEAARTILERQSVAGIVAGLRLLRDRPDQTEVLGTITVPTLVLCGAEDRVTPPDEMEAMAARIPGATYSRVPITGHLMPFEQPGAFAAGVSTFLAQLGA